MTEVDVVAEDRGRPPTSPVREKVADVLLESLAGMIQSGELRVGARLPTERDLMKRFGISRAAVREAIAALADRGLIVTRRGYRPVVTQPDYGVAIRNLGRVLGHLASEQQGAWGLFETRVFIEAALARYAAEHARPADLEELRAALQANRDAIGQHREFYATDIAFHGLLYRIPGNPILPAVHSAYVEWLMRHWERMQRGENIDRMNYAGHESIFTAIVERKADTAEQMVRSHLTAAWEFVRITFPTPK